ncbi:hypothetical protein PHLH7_23880 [Pseudomonas sp. Ost2]|nr:hypothetical protein PHLH7_23880 [Pseudomonas sp. Ost2]
MTFHLALAVAALGVSLVDIKGWDHKGTYNY